MNELILPSTVRIGFADYAIVHMSSDDIELADYTGITCNNTHVIRIDMEGATARNVNTALHEILHAAWNMGDLDDTEKEEKAVSVLANQLTQILRDNPAIFIRMITALNPDKET